MEAYQIIAGFSDIKSEFITKTGTDKTLAELHLWFSYEDEVLYVYDYSDHTKALVLAVFNSGNSTWSVYLRPYSYGRALALYILSRTKLERIKNKFNEMYVLYGFVPLSRL